MKINRIAIFSVPVSDQEAAKTFYRDVLGFQVTSDKPMGPNQRWITVTPEGAETSITLVTWFPNMLPGSMQGIVLNTSEIQETRATLAGRGVEISEIKQEPWGHYATFKDLDGNGFVLQQHL